MDATREPKIVESVADIAAKIRFAQAGDDALALGRVIFLIGAGCSVTAGIPGAMEIAQIMAREVAMRFGCHPPMAVDVVLYRALIAKRLLEPCLTGDADAEPSDTTIDWYRVYEAMFRQH
jgi:hypothetical protein